MCQCIIKQNSFSILPIMISKLSTTYVSMCVLKWKGKKIELTRNLRFKTFPLNGIQKRFPNWESWRDETISNRNFNWKSLLIIWVSSLPETLYCLIIQVQKALYGIVKDKNMVETLSPRLTLTLGQLAYRESIV